MEGKCFVKGKGMILKEEAMCGLRRVENGVGKVCWQKMVEECRMQKCKIA